MRFRLLTALVFSLIPAVAVAEGAAWQRFVVPTTGTNVEIPVTIFSKDAELPDGGTGRRFYTDDRRANLTVQSVANPRKRLAGHVSCEEESAARNHVQKGDTEFLRRVQHPQRPALVQPL